MSHIATVSVQIKDLDALDDACRRLDLVLVRGQKSHRYYSGNQAECEHAIKVAGNERAYEIGLVRRADGQPGWDIAWDSFAGGHGLVEKVGQNCKRLKQEYAVAVARRQAQRQGFRLVEQRRADGVVQLTLSK